MQILFLLCMMYSVLQFMYGIHFMHLSVLSLSFFHPFDPFVGLRYCGCLWTYRLWPLLTLSLPIVIRGILVGHSKYKKKKKKKQDFFTGNG